VKELAGSMNSPSWSLAIPFEMSKIAVRNAGALFFFAGRSMFAFEREPIFAQLRKDDTEPSFKCQFEPPQTTKKKPHRKSDTASYFKDDNYFRTVVTFDNQGTSIFELEDCPGPGGFGQFLVTASCHRWISE
jgi:hypothetical protein